MKDTIITGKRKRTELITLLVCFILANLANLYAVIEYNSPAIEMLTSLGYVAAAAILIYAVWCGIRLAIYGMKNLFRKKEVR